MDWESLFEKEIMLNLRCENFKLFLFKVLVANWCAILIPSGSDLHGTLRLIGFCNE